jgi:hypothetical protein
MHLQGFSVPPRFFESSNLDQRRLKYRGAILLSYTEALEADAALYEKRGLASRRFWKSLIGDVSTALWVVVTVFVLVSCLLLVYLGAVLLAGWLSRLVLMGFLL